MQQYLDMSNNLATEIERVSRHLEQLRSAYNAVQLLTGNPPESSALSLSHRASSGSVVDVEDVKLLMPSRPGLSKGSNLSGRHLYSANKAELELADHPVKKNTPSKKKPKSKSITKIKASAEAPIKHRPSGGLPSTGESFWLGLIGKKRTTSSEVVDKAVSTLGLPPEKRARLMNRFSVWVFQAQKKRIVVDRGLKNGLKVYQQV